VKPRNATERFRVILLSEETNRYTMSLHVPAEQSDRVEACADLTNWLMFV